MLGIILRSVFTRSRQNDASSTTPKRAFVAQARNARLGTLVRLLLHTYGRLIRSLQGRVRGQILDQRGTVAISFAVAALPIAIGVATAVDFAGMTAGRAALQRAVDNAALSGAASYIADKTTLHDVAVFTARGAFCSATATLPNGFTVNASSDNIPCGTLQGANVSAVITGYQTGTPGLFPTESGCAPGNTTPASGYTCAFAVTVTATATTNMTFASLLGASHTLSVTATAVNPFIDLNRALSAKLVADARYANSIWVYPLLLNNDGQPDFSSDSGARPDASACNGDPTSQGWCGLYSMIATNVYSSCTTARPCTLKDGTTIIEGGAVKQIHASSAVITATTPLGIALQSAAGGHQTPPGSNPFINYNTYGYQTKTVLGKTTTLQVPPYNCTYPAIILYNTVAQTYDSNNVPLLVSSNGSWTLPTHWFYSSYLANNKPPSQRLLDVQGSIQDVRAVPEVLYDANNKGSDNPTTCTDDTTSTATAKKTPHQAVSPTTYPTPDPANPTGSPTNCSLYIVRDPTIDPTDPNSPYPIASNNGTCFSPYSTPGQLYATLSCQNYGNSTFAFFWNDMGGRAGTDDKDYGNATMIVKCAAAPKIILIN